MSKRNMTVTEREVLKLAAERYDLALAKGKHFTRAELGDALHRDLVSRLGDKRSVATELLSAAAHSAIRTVDDERTRPDPQASLLDELDRAVPVEESKRIARRRMKGRDWSAHLANVSANASRINAAAAKENQRYVALAPYLGDGMDTEAAIRAWQAAHPDEVLP